MEASIIIHLRERCHGTCDAAIEYIEECEKQLQTQVSELATLRAQLDAKEGECQRLKDDLSTAIDDGNRSRQIIYAMAEALKPETGEHNIDCAKRVATERDKLRAEVEHRTKQRDEFQNLFIEASDGFNQRGEQLTRLRAELDAVRKERDEARSQFEYYSGWAQWNPGLWRISFPESGPCAEFVCSEADFQTALTPSQQPDNLEGGDEPCASLIVPSGSNSKSSNAPNSHIDASNPQPESPIPSGVGQPSRPEPVKAGEWLPIESAPKDGTHIRIFEPDGYYEIVGLYNNGRWLTFPGLTECFPTHWQSQSAPPIAPEGKATEGEG